MRLMLELYMHSIWKKQKFLESSSNCSTDKFLNISKPQFCHLWDEDNKNYLPEWLWELYEKNVWESILF